MIIAHLTTVTDNFNIFFINECICIKLRWQTEIGDFQHILTHSFYLFSFQMRLKRTWFVVHEEHSLCVSCSEIESSTKSKQPTKGFLVSFHLQKGIFSSFFILEWRWRVVCCKKIILLLPSYSWIPSSSIYLCVLALYVCRVSFSKYFHNLLVYTFPSLFFLSLSPTLFQSPSNREKLMIMWMIYWL